MPDWAIWVDYLNAVASGICTVVFGIEETKEKEPD